MSYSVDLQAEVSVRLYIPRTVLGQVNGTVTRIVRSNHLIFEGISHSNAVLLPDIQDFYSLQYLCIVLGDVSRQLSEEHIPHSLYSTVYDRKFDHYLYWITQDLEEIGRKCDVPNRKLEATNSPKMHSEKIATTYEAAVEEFRLNAWESEHSHNQQGIYDTPRVNQRALRDAFLAKKLLDN